MTAPISKTVPKPMIQVFGVAKISEALNVKETNPGTLRDKKDKNKGRQSPILYTCVSRQLSLVSQLLAGF
jgi:hypothetical protein